RSNPFIREEKYGLLRFARNDVERPVATLRAEKLAPAQAPRRGDFVRQSAIIRPDQIKQQRRLLLRLQQLRVALASALHLPPFLRRHSNPSEVVERPRKCPAVGPGKAGAVIEPVESGND